MRLEPFLMERWQSVHEHRVAFNLSESGVHPMTVRELLDLPGGDGPSGPALGDIALGYAQGNGSPRLRSRVAALYPGAGESNVLITHGGAEANFLSTMFLLGPGDEAVVMLPNYMQIHGLVPAWGARVVPWPLCEDRGWDADIDALGELVNEKTRLILITNPNNPTGRVLREDFLDAVAAVAAKSGAWVISDEIYRGAEAAGDETPSIWGRYDRVLITSGLSKAYGLPGLRTGWAASPDESMIAALWSYHDYSTICPSPLTQALAVHALEPARRRNILERTRGLVRQNLPVITAWATSQGDRFRFRPPDAGAILWMRYADEINSTELAEKVRAEEDTLIVPGDHFGMDRFLRLGFGSERAPLEEGLLRVRRAMDRL